MAFPATTFLTPEQYLEIDRDAERPSEYIDGQMYPVEAASRNHGWILTNTLTGLAQRLRGSSCRAATTVRVQIRRFGVFTYPDIVVTCGPDKVMDGDKDTLVDATLIVEILSPSTQNYDRSQKFDYYRSLPSLVEYLVLAQNEIRAEHHVRQENGFGLFGEFTSPDHELELNSIGCRLNLGSLYEDVDFGTR